MADKKPSIDEEEQARDEEDVEEVVEEPQETEEPAEPEGDVEEPAEEEPAQDDEPEEEPRSRRENLRIQQLVSKLREQQQSQPQQSQPTQPTQGGLNYKEAFNVDDEVAKRLEQDRQQQAQNAYNQGMSQAQQLSETNLFHTRLEVDAPQVASKYPFLDKNSEEFHPALAETVNEMFLSTVGYNSSTRTVQNADIRYRDFVDGIFELADEVASSKLEKTRKNVTSQAAKTGLRPDGSKSKRLNLNKAPQDMTDEELEAVIKQNLPS